ncbi:MAG: hypothetical protein ACLT98_15395 [Eggerthellaceae bacterium]
MAATLAAAIDADEADVYIVNFANPDMVGHTGVIPAAVAAIEAVDAGVSQVLARRAQGRHGLITADHATLTRCSARTAAPSRLIPRRLCRSRSWTSRKRAHARRSARRALRHRAHAARAHRPRSPCRHDGEEPAGVGGVFAGMRRGGRGWRPAPSRPATRAPAPPLP